MPELFKNYCDVYFLVNKLITESEDSCFLLRNESPFKYFQNTTTLFFAQLSYKLYDFFLSLHVFQ